MTSYRVNLMECSDCTCQFTSWVVASCNTLGAEFYTDGYVDGSMHDEGSRLLACPGCHAFLWRDDVSVMASVRDSEYFADKALQELPRDISVRGRHYEEILSKRLWCGEAQEKYIRVRAWWSFNRGYRGEIDGYREPESVRKMMLEIIESVGGMDEIAEELLREELARNGAVRRKFAETYLTLDMSPPRDLPPEQTANLVRLVALLGTVEPDEFVLRAEALRELGRFEECLQALDRTPYESASRAATQIRQLALQRKRRVEVLQ